jgi:GT2 family glycosyltransferase
MAVRSIVGGRLQSAGYGKQPGTPLPSLLSTIEGLSAIPSAHLTRRHAVLLNDALRRIREFAEEAPEVALPDEAWELYDRRNGESGLASLYARRILAQYREYTTNALAGAAVQRAGAFPARLKSRLGQWLLHSPYHRWYTAFLGLLPSAVKPGFRQYAAWRAMDAEASPPVEHLRSIAERWKKQPRISVLLATHNPQPDWLGLAIDSVKRQIYGNWQLCICDDSSDDPQALERGLAPAARGPQTTFRRSTRPVGISGAFNEAAEMASGDYVAFLDHDDLLAPDALYRVVEALQETDADVLYTDEDFIDEHGVPLRPHFKPDWSPHLLDACMYFGHLVVMRSRLFETLGGFRSECDGAQDYDLALRATEAAGSVVHVPHVGYHWRMHRGSVAKDMANKPETHRKGRHCLQDAARRRGWSDAVLNDSGVSNLFYLDRHPSALSSVHVLVWGGGPHNAWERELPPDIKVTYLDSLNKSANRVSAESDREVLVLLDGRLRPTNSDWYECLLRPLSDPAIGIVGAKVLDGTGAIDQAGFATGVGDGVGRVGHGLDASAHWLWLGVPREVTAVAMNCMAIRRDLFLRAGGLDAAMDAEYQAVDLCLRCRRLGVRIIVETRAVLRDSTAGSKKLASAHSWVRFVRKWPDVVNRPDEYLSPNLRQDREDFQFC